ncbi:MAG: NAD-dependent epimerase/dehydratase family protein, partial [Atribacterota bacterium]
MAKYLVTGGAGFIGSNIIKRLLEIGEFVRVVDNFSTGRKENIKEFIKEPNFEFIEGDLTNLSVYRKAVKGMDFVLHQAAIPSVPRSISDPLTINDSNIVGTLNLLVAARDEKVKKFVYASSSSIYGDSPKLPKREDFPINPISPYALTKYTGERYTQLFWQVYKLPTICLRYFNVFGPKQDPNSQYAAVIPKFIIALLKGEKPIIYGDGRQSRDFTYI